VCVVGVAWCFLLLIEICLLFVQWLRACSCCCVLCVMFDACVLLVVYCCICVSSVSCYALNVELYVFA